MGNYNYKRVTKACLNCGVAVAMEPRNKFCTKRCAAVWRSKNNPKWLEAVRRANRKAATPERMARLIVSLKKKWQDPDFRGRMISLRQQQSRNRRRNFEYLSRDDRVFVFRSKLELAYGEWLDRQELTWSYERDTFLLSDGRRYTPDFWVQEWECYIELAGRYWGDPGSVEKAEIAAEDGKPIRVVEGSLVAEVLASV